VYYAIEWNGELLESMLGFFCDIFALEDEVEVLFLEPLCLQAFEGPYNVFELLNFERILDRDLFSKSIELPDVEILFGGEEVH
jgi:hypothetical protein